VSVDRPSWEGPPVPVLSWRVRVSSDRLASISPAFPTPRRSRPSACR
jgi:hypothetical protein